MDTCVRVARTTTEYIRSAAALDPTCITSALAEIPEAVPPPSSAPSSRRRRGRTRRRRSKEEGGGAGWGARRKRRRRRSRSMRA
eukprot:1527888-Pyramimonas_sp.AAC.1